MSEWLVKKAGAAVDYRNKVSDADSKSRFCADIHPPTDYCRCCFSLFFFFFSFFVVCVCSFASLCSTYHIIWKLEIPAKDFIIGFYRWISSLNIMIGYFHWILSLDFYIRLQHCIMNYLDGRHRRLFNFQYCTIIRSAAVLYRELHTWT